MTKHTKSLLCLSAAAAVLCTLSPLFSVAVADLIIETPQQMITFMKEVNKNRRHFSGETIYLVSDIDMANYSSLFAPIGADASKATFTGTFDGKGHVISNLVLSTTAYASTGLFGHSGGMTLRDLVLDGSCAISSAYALGNEHVGGLVGICEALSGRCHLSGLVNMAAVALEPASSGYRIRTIGGIAGDLKLGTAGTLIENCVNYGTLSSADGNTDTNAGGVVGLTEYASSSDGVHTIRNNANYGFIRMPRADIGGIVGEAGFKTSVANCLSVGLFEGSYVPSSVGAVVGHSSGASFGEQNSVKNCYWHKAINADRVMGTSSYRTSVAECTSFSDPLVLTKAVTVEGKNYTDLVDALNAFDTSKTLPSWHKVRLVLNGGSLEGTSLSLIPAFEKHFPAPIEDMLAFSGWYTDDAFTSKYDPAKTSSLEGLVLYAKWSFVIEYQTNGGVPITPTPVDEGKPIPPLKNTTKEGYTLAMWCMDEELQIPFSLKVMPNTSITVYAKWTPNSYNVTFVTDKSSTSTILEYNTTIVYPNITDPCYRTRWCTKDGKTCNPATVPAHDIVLYLEKAYIIGIGNGAQLIEFVKDVNIKGVSYEGETVRLLGDIDMTNYSSAFRPIGCPNKTCAGTFSGTFDGQGHVISNLVVNISDISYVGLFGNSRNGTSIKDTIIDSSCVFYSAPTYGVYTFSLGSFIGYCSAKDRPCEFSGVVSMAFLHTPTGGTTPRYIGGIVGHIDAFKSSAALRNCVNYGSILNDGSNQASYMGGLIGYMECSLTESASILNCANYGKVLYSASYSNTLYMGGLVGYSNSGLTAENSVSIGSVESRRTASSVGAIVGYSRGESKKDIIKNCYWLGTEASIKPVGQRGKTEINNTLDFNNLLVFNGTVAVNGKNYTDLVDALNAFDTSKTLPSWHKVRLVLNGGSLEGTSLSLIPAFEKHFPAPIEDMLAFSGWYTDDAFTSKYDPAKTSSLEGLVLYAKWSFVIEYQTNGGVPITPTPVDEGKPIPPLKNTTKEGYTLAMWCMDEELQIPFSLKVMPNTSITVYAKWTPNSYNVTFVTDKSSTSTILEYNTTIVYPNITDPCYRTRWCTKDGKTCNPATVPAHDIVLYLEKAYIIGIGNGAQLIEFVKDVNIKGVSYEGETVRLLGDIDMTNYSSAFRPIGALDVHPFSGTFDGQGHVISNLKAHLSDGAYLGLFGFSHSGMSVKDTIIDSSCSFVSDAVGVTSAGGFVGACIADDRNCSFYNLINMADVTITTFGSTDRNFGGIFGSAEAVAKGKNITVVNCVNYGRLVNAGSSGTSRMGGLAGYASTAVNSDGTAVVFQNSINYGSVTYESSKQDSLFVGGLVGFSGPRSTLENCVNVGTIVANYAGNIVGRSVGLKLGAENVVSHCYWLESRYSYAAAAYSNTTLTEDVDFNSGLVLSKAVSFSHGTATTSLVDALGRYSTSAYYAKWYKIAVSSNGGAFAGTTLSASVPIISGRIPAPLKESCIFDGWYTEMALRTQYNASLPAKTVDGSHVYAGWLSDGSLDVYSIRYMPNGGEDVGSNVAKYKTPIGDFPVPANGWVTFLGWYMDPALNVKCTYTLMPQRNLVLYAKWDQPSNVILKHITKEYSETQVAYPGAKIAILDPVLEGHTFDGWFNDEAFASPFTIIVMPKSNLEIYAKWLINSYNISFLVDDTVFASSLQEYGSKIVYPRKDPLKTSHKFVGWVTDAKIPGDLVPPYDVTFTANFTLYSASSRVAASFLTLAVAMLFGM